MGAYYNRRLPNSSKTADGSLAENRQNIQTNSNLRHKRGSARDDFRHGNQIALLIRLPQAGGRLKIGTGTR